MKANWRSTALGLATLLFGFAQIVNGSSDGYGLVASGFGLIVASDS